MAARQPSTSLLRGAIRFSSARPGSFLPCQPQLRFYSDIPPPPLLATLKTDLKAAMRAKDQPRLSAIRGVLGAVTNLSKTPDPVRTDAQVVQLMRKQLRSMADAAAEFKAADRQDLVDKEEATMAHLQEYVKASGVRVLDGADLDAAVTEVVESIQAEGKEGNITGEVMKRLIGPGGKLEGTVVDKKEVAELVKKALA